MMLTDVHPLLFFKIYHDIYPAFLNRKQTINDQHLCSLILMFGLLMTKKDETLATAEGVSIGKVIGILSSIYLSNAFLFEN